MVAVTHAVREAAAPQAVAAWLDTLAGVYPAEDRAAFEAALAYARERCGSARGRDGEPLIDRAIGTAMIVAGLKLDAGTVRAALLIGLAGANAFDAEDVAARFGADIATLVAGAARMDEIRATPPQGDAAERAAQAERLRKMLLAMVEDIRVVLIKLAERTAALRYLMAGAARSEARQQAAREVLDLFAPKPLPVDVPVTSAFLAGTKMIDRDLRPDVQQIVVRHAELGELGLRLDGRAGEMAPHRLRGVLDLGQADAELNRSVAVLLLRALCHDLAVLHAENGDRNMLANVIVDARHAQLLCDYT